LTTVAEAIGRKSWAFAGGRVPFGATGKEPELSSYDAIAILNTGGRAADVRITIWLVDDEPLGPFEIQVGAKRVRRIRVNDLIDPQAVPLDTEYGMTVESSRLVVVQFTRQDTRQRANASMSTLAFPVS
jgi:hypothetical protein